MEETWKSLVRYGLECEVSDLGNVRDFWRDPISVRIDKTSGTKICGVRSGEKRTNIKARRLVAVGFLGYKLDTKGFAIKHANGDKTDCRLSNLAVWPTASYCRYHGLDEPKCFSFEIGLIYKEELKDVIATVLYNTLNVYLGTFHTEWEAKSSIERFKRIHGIKD